MGTSLKSDPVKGYGCDTATDLLATTDGPWDRFSIGARVWSRRSPNPDEQLNDARADRVINTNVSLSLAVRTIDINSL